MLVLILFFIYDSNTLRYLLFPCCFLLYNDIHRNLCHKPLIILTLPYFLVIFFLFFISIILLIISSSSFFYFSFFFIYFFLT